MKKKIEIKIVIKSRNLLNLEYKKQQQKDFDI